MKIQILQEKGLTDETTNWHVANISPGQPFGKATFFADGIFNKLKLFLNCVDDKVFYREGYTIGLTKSNPVSDAQPTKEPLFIPIAHKQSQLKIV